MEPVVFWKEWNRDRLDFGRKDGKPVGVFVKFGRNWAGWKELGRFSIERMKNLQKKPLLNCCKNGNIKSKHGSL